MRCWLDPAMAISWNGSRIMEKKKLTIMAIDPGVGESWSVTTIVGPPVEEGGDFTIKAVHEGAWGPESEGFCKARDDRTHCEHWWDGDGCCSCGAPAMTQEEMIEQGMIIPVESPEEVPVSIEVKLDVEAD